MSKGLIGQTRLKETLCRQAQAGTLPAFTILVGDKGQGKDTALQWLFNKYGCTVITTGTKIDDVRDMIEKTKSLSSQVIYYIPEADSMSVGAKNSLLKITEEPPKNLRIVMTLESDGSTLPTIKSRAQVLYMEPYKIDELKEYCQTYHKISENDMERVLEVAHSPGQIDKLLSIGFNDFYDFVEKVYDNLWNVSTGNSFKISNQLAFKPDEEGYPVELFLEIFKLVCVDEMKSAAYEKDDLTSFKFLYNCTTTTVRTLGKMRYRGVSKKALFDIWLLDIKQLEE